MVKGAGGIDGNGPWSLGAIAQLWKRILLGHRGHQQTKICLPHLIDQ